MGKPKKQSHTKAWANSTKQKAKNINEDTKLPENSIIVGSPLYAFLSPFKPAQNQWVIKYIVILFALVIRCAVSFGPYSGMATPPMFGDFEAQRHWLDITINLPIEQWYWYKLEYWGLDYPPLTAYHSWLLGHCGKLVNPDWFRIDATDGIENPGVKSFMRATVLVSDALVYVPAVYYYTKWFNNNVMILSKNSLLNQILAIAIILFQPTLILVDHGHFQYNSVMLGLALLAFDCFLYNHLVLGCVFFVFSLCFKQMALFYAPFVFAYLLGLTFNPFNTLLVAIVSKIPYVKKLAKSFAPSNVFNIVNLILIALATLSSFALMFLPLYLVGGLSNLIQSIHRIFPFNRGIFEDKVANFWCATNVLVKYKQYSLNTLKLSALCFTLLSILPSCVAGYLKPKKHLLAWGLASCSWGFFLFSFQVHEKSVLLPLLPSNLLLCYINDKFVFRILSWTNNIALFSLGPLLKRDGLSLQYYSLVILSNWLVGNLTPNTLANNIKSIFSLQFSTDWIFNLLIVSTTSLVIVLDFLPYYIVAPANLPDLWVVANVTLSFACFMLFYLWVTTKMLVLSFTD